jgi:exodeoxyribonuclease VII large subunit
VVIYPSQVQGADAPAALVAALRLAAARREVDSLLLVRGGGSLEDLWSFNDEALVHAIASSPIPVICGVGHESDVTLADLAADLRAATPTAAAELAAPARAEALARLDALADRLQRRVHHWSDTQAQRLDALALRLGGPARALATQRQALSSLDERLRLALRRSLVDAAREPAQLGARLLRAMRHQRESQAQRLDVSAKRLAALDPQRVLARGYAWMADAKGQPVMSVHSVSAGEHLDAVWADGSARMQVLELHPDDQAAPAKP